MSPPVVLAVLAAAIMHASWNAITKGTTDRVALMVRMTAVSTALALPVALVAPAPARQSWAWLGVSVVLHVAYALTLTAAYRHGDFNQAYPIARGLGPVLVALSAVGFLDESLPAPAIAGVALVATGAASIGVSSIRRRRNLSGLGSSMLTAVAIAAYTVVDGVAVRSSGSALGYGAWLIALQGPLMAGCVLGLRIRSRCAGAAVASTGGRPRWPVACAAGALSGGAYALVLWAQTRAGLAGVAALRETSIVFAAVIGAVVLGDPAGRTRILASTVIAGGGMLLALSG